MNCQDALKNLYEFIDRELDTATEQEIQAHLKHCDGCLGKFEAERLFKEMLQAKAGGEKVSEEQRARILARIESAPEARGAWRSFDWRMVFMAALAAVHILAIGFVVFSLGR
jgi:mycothiol system anti-sigma-R factor